MLSRQKGYTSKKTVFNHFAQQNLIIGKYLPIFNNISERNWPDKPIFNNVNRLNLIQ